MGGDGKGESDGGGLYLDRILVGGGYLSCYLECPESPRVYQQNRRSNFPKGVIYGPGHWW